MGNQELSVDRRASGDVSFVDPDVGNVHAGPLALTNGRSGTSSGSTGRRWRSSVAPPGRPRGGASTVPTEQIFPDPDSVGLALTAEGGTAVVEQVTVTPLRSAWQ